MLASGTAGLFTAAAFHIRNRNAPRTSGSGPEPSVKSPCNPRCTCRIRSFPKSYPRCLPTAITRSQLPPIDHIRIRKPPLRPIHPHSPSAKRRRMPLRPTMYLIPLRHPFSLQDRQTMATALRRHQENRRHHFLTSKKLNSRPASPPHGLNRKHLVRLHLLHRCANCSASSRVSNIIRLYNCPARTWSHLHIVSVMLSLQAVD